MTPVSEVDPSIRNNFRAMEYWIDGAMEREETVWVVPPDPTERMNDVVAAFSELRVPGAIAGTSRFICISQWLGVRAAEGDVRYSARYVESGPLLIWRKGAQRTDEIEALDVSTRQLLPLEADMTTSLVDGLRFGIFCPIGSYEAYRKVEVSKRRADRFMKLHNLLMKSVLYR